VLRRDVGRDRRVIRCRYLYDFQAAIGDCKERKPCIMGGMAPGVIWFHGLFGSTDPRRVYAGHPPAVTGPGKQIIVESFVVCGLVRASVPMRIRVVRIGVEKGCW
jgi:hypothetical protein